MNYARKKNVENWLATEDVAADKYGSLLEAFEQAKANVGKTYRNRHGPVSDILNAVHSDQILADQKVQLQNLSFFRWMWILTQLRQEGHRKQFLYQELTPRRVNCICSTWFCTCAPWKYKLFGIWLERPWSHSKHKNCWWMVSVVCCLLFLLFSFASKFLCFSVLTD